MPGYLNEFGSSPAAITLAKILSDQHPTYHNKVAGLLKAYATRIKIIYECIYDNNKQCATHLIILISRQLKQTILSKRLPKAVESHVLNVAKSYKMKYLSKETNNG